MEVGVLEIDGRDPLALGKGLAYGSLGLHLELLLLHGCVEGLQIDDRSHLAVLLGDQKHVAVVAQRW